MQPTPQQPPIPIVKVQILLVGGHQYTLYLKQDEPLLQNLIAPIVARAQKQEADFSGLFQIPIHEGRAALCFSSEHLVGIVTEPPVYVQPTEEIKLQPTEPQPPATQLQSPGILPSKYVQLDNFLTPEETNRLLYYVFQKESEFVSTVTSTGEANYRQSMVLYSFPEFHKLITARIQEIVPTICSKLGMSPFKVAEIEAQLTSHNDGNYYKIHNDNGSPDTATREFTYVYYFHREPKPFSGGELLIYDSKVENNFYVKADSYHTIEPRNNSIVFFLSRYLHEVSTVQCPSKAFVDSRFTINGWVRRQANGR